jgi:alpha-mannosidase
VFTISYDDGTSSSITQTLSDWYEPGGYKGEADAVAVPYRIERDGAKDSRTFHVYGYSFPLDSGKVVRSITLPHNEQVLVFAMTLVPPAGS